MIEETPKGIKRKLSTSDSDTDTVAKKEELHTTCVSAEDDTSRQVSKNCGLKCIGILPGLGTYEDSSDSDCSSDTDQETEPCPSKYDILGRKIKISKDKEKS